MRGCACSPSGRSSSPPTRPRSGSTPPGAGLRGRRAAPPAGRRVDRLRPRHRPARRVRHARLRGLPPGDAAAAGLGRARPPARAPGVRLRAADRARLRARRRDRASSSSWPRSRRSGSRSAPLLARRIVPEPWASGAALLVGLSPPALAHATTVYPDLMAGTMLAGAVLAALRVRERPDLPERGGGRDAARAAAVAGAEVPAAGGAGGGRAGALDRAPRPAHGGARAAEIMVASLVVYATLNDRLYGGLVPSAVAASGAPATGARLGRRLPRADPAARGAVARPRRRAAALGAGARAQRLRGLAAVALAPHCTSRAWSPSAPTPRSPPALRCSCARRVVLVAAFAAPTLDGRLVPGPPPHGRLPGRRRAGGLGPAPRAAHGRRARRR